ncbi:unnamed protein product, partial [Candidula unifasciata]
GSDGSGESDIDLDDDDDDDDAEDDDDIQGIGGGVPLKGQKPVPRGDLDDSDF